MRRRIRGYKIPQYYWVQCPFCHRIQECWFDGYEYECPAFERTFTLK